MENQLVYASFWQRLAAHLFDNIFTGALYKGITIIYSDPTAIVAILLMTAYYAGFEGSFLQATVGKQVMKLKVTDLNGERVSYLRAFARFVCMMVIPIIPAMIIIVILIFYNGYMDDMTLTLYFILLWIMFLFIDCLFIFITPRKQALHDMITGCLVLKRNDDSARGLFS